MKKQLVLLTMIILAIACNKDKNQDKYIPPYNLTRYTKKMAGKWEWQGEYRYGSVRKDTGGTFEVIFIDDTTIKFRETIFRFRWRDPLIDSNVLADYVNPLLNNTLGHVEAISYWYKDDELIYSQIWGQYEKIRLEGRRK